MALFDQNSPGILGKAGGWMTPERAMGLQALGMGMSQLAAGQPVNLSGPAQALMERQQQAKMRQALEGSGVMGRFTPEQRAILASMPPQAAMQIISGEVFKAPPAPVKLTTFEGPDGVEYSFNPVTGETKPLTEAQVAAPDGWRDLTPEEVVEKGLDPEKGPWQIGLGGANEGQIKPVGGALVDIDLGDNLTPGQAALDKAYADRYLEWVTGRGSDATQQAAQIASVAEALEQGAEWTGPMIGIQGDFVRAITNPEAQDAKDRVESVVQRSLKDTLGAQFTEREGERLIQRAYNINLRPEQNAARLRALYQTIQARVDAENAMADYFAENGTIVGMPRIYVPTVDDMLAAMDQAVPAPAESAAPSEGMEGMPEGFPEPDLWPYLTPEDRAKWQN